MYILIISVFIVSKDLLMMITVAFYENAYYESM